MADDDKLDSLAAAVQSMHAEMRQGFQRLDARIDKQGEQIGGMRKDINALLYEQERLLVTTSRIDQEQQQQGRKLDSVLSTVVELRTKVHNLEEEAQ